jgi:hypothetical protein
MINAGYMRTGIFGLPIDEARFSVRGFNCASPARARLEQVGTSVVHYYNLAVAEGCGDNLAEYLGFVSDELCGFAHEGAAMGLFAIDALAPFSRGNFDRFISGPAKNHVYMSFIGAGLAIGALHLSFERAVSKYAHFSRTLILDGYGFFHAFFKTDPAVRRMRMPSKVAANPVYRERYDAGVGRALWFVEAADPDRIAFTIGAFEPGRRPDLWSGVGLAATYAGAIAEDGLARLAAASGRYRLHTAQGAAFAAGARLRAGNLVPHVELACELLCGLDARAAAGVTDSALLAVRGGEAEDYERWRAEIRARLARA